ncbi:hypothetical protein CBS101457_000229 [Exobasidium rhododendri]|nr:hypothetical protein CBS101457_000229 [Exobasidium rhododendri]
MTPFMALALLSGNESQIKRVINGVYPRFYKKDIDAWKGYLSDLDADILEYSLCQVTGQNADYVRNFLSNKKVTPDLALQLSKASSDELHQFAVDAKIMKKEHITPPEPVMREGDKKHKPWMDGTTSSERKQIVEIVKKHFSSRAQGTSMVYNILTRENVKTEDRLGLTILALEQKHGDGGSRDYIMQKTGVRPR